jgi:hypothetical protein
MYGPKYDPKQAAVKLEPILFLIIDIHGNVEF